MYELSRKFTYVGDARVVVHDLFIIAEESTGVGLARPILRTTVSAYLRAGVTRIELTAKAAGSYVWARYGFCLHEGELANVCAQLLDAMDEGTLGLVTDLDGKMPDPWDEADLNWIRRLIEFLDKDNPEEFSFLWKAQLHGKSIGYRLLYDISWKGYLDLTNGARVDQFFAYANRS